MLFHRGESDDFIVQERKSLCFKYFACIDRTQILLSFVRIFQASLHWKALLMASVLRSPRPPLALGVQTLSHAMRGNPLSVFDLFQKNSRFIRSKLFVTVLGSRKHCIVCAGNDSRWDCINTVWPSLDRRFAFQPSNFVVALLSRLWKLLDVVRCWKIGQPKYFPSDSLCVILKIPATNCRWEAVAFAEYVSVDLW